MHWVWGLAEPARLAAACPSWLMLSYRHPFIHPFHTSDARSMHMLTTLRRNVVAFGAFFDKLKGTSSAAHSSVRLDCATRHLCTKIPTLEIKGNKRQHA